MAMTIDTQNSMSNLPRVVSIGLVFSFLGALAGIAEFYAYLHGQPTLLNLLSLPVSNLACAVLGIPVLVTLFTLLGILGTMLFEKFKGRSQHR